MNNYTVNIKDTHCSMIVMCSNNIKKKSWLSNKYTFIEGLSMGRKYHVKSYKAHTSLFGKEFAEYLILNDNLDEKWYNSELFN